MAARIPRIEKMAQMGVPKESWRDNAPRLTEDQKVKLTEITRQVYNRHMKTAINRKTFGEIHEKIEDELANLIAENFGLIAAVEWRGIFPEHVARAFNKAGKRNNGFVDGISPTHDFLDSELFDYIEVFQPRVVLLQFADYENYIKSTEQSVVEAQKRRTRGDAYYTDKDRQINFRPEMQEPGSIGVTPVEEDE